MSIASLPADLQGPAQKIAEVLGSHGATKAVLFGEPKLFNIAVAGLSEDQVLRASGRLLMDARLEVELVRMEDPSNPYSQNGSKGIELL